MRPSGRGDPGLADADDADGLADADDAELAALRAELTRLDAELELAEAKAAQREAAAALAHEAPLGSAGLERQAEAPSYALSVRFPRGKLMDQMRPEEMAEALKAKFHATEARLWKEQLDLRFELTFADEIAEARAVAAASTISSVRSPAELSTPGWFGAGFRTSSLPTELTVESSAAAASRAAELATWERIRRDDRTDGRRRGGGGGLGGLGADRRADTQRRLLLPACERELRLLGVPTVHAGRLSAGELRAALRVRARLLQEEMRASPTAGAGSDDMYELSRAYDVVKSCLQ